MKPTVGVLAKFIIKSGMGEELMKFINEGLLIVEGQPATTMWIGFRITETEYGAFAAFANETDRQTLLATGGPKLAPKYGYIFAEPLSFKKVDIVASRIVG
ncbi:MAG TPA: hypothetical protein VLG11_02480 [Candidatus Saccharimonadales bacterium]|nr:hypothetical protein [Candidatus Saccharimonadales bacterium]